MLHVKIERRQIATEMQLRVVIEWATTVEGQTVLDGPAQNVAQGIKVKMEFERNRIVQPEIFVVDGAVMHHAYAEGDDAAIESPDEKTNAFRHELAQF